MELGGLEIETNRALPCWGIHPAQVRGARSRGQYWFKLVPIRLAVCWGEVKGVGTPRISFQLNPDQHVTLTRAHGFREPVSAFGMVPGPLRHAPYDLPPLGL